MTNLKIWNKIKDYYNDLDKYYGAGINNKNATRSFILIMPISIILLYFSLGSTIIEKISFYYIIIMFLIVFLIIIFSNLYDNPKNNPSNERKKKILKIINILLILLFLGVTSPVLLSLCIFNIIIKILGGEVFVDNSDRVIFNASIYLIVLFICMNNRFIRTFGFLVYFMCIGSIYLISYLIRKLINKIIRFTSYQNKYNYVYKSRRFQQYFINILTTTSGVLGLLVSGFDDITEATYTIMPLIIFSGLEQISSLASQRINEKYTFLTNLYEELIILKNVAILQIKDYTCIKIRIKLSITPYTIENYKNYFFMNKKITSKDKSIIDTLSRCQSMLLKEYNVYKSVQKDDFEVDLNNNIENLAKCLTDIK